MPEFSVKRFVLLSLAERAGAVVSASAFRPVLRNLLVEVKPASLRVSATDLDLSVMVSTGAVSTEVEFTFQVPAQRLIQILREAPEGDIKLVVPLPEEGVRKVSVLAGTGSWDLRVPDAEYPVLPDTESSDWHDVDRAAFLRALRTVRHAVSRDGANQGLACVAVRVDSAGAKVTAYDGARFQQAEMPAFPFPVQIPAIGSPAAVDELVRMLSAGDELKTVSVAKSASWLAFRVGSCVFVSRLLTAQGVDTSKLVLKPAMENKQPLEVEREALAGAVRRVRINADPETSAIGLSLSTGLLTVVARDKFGNEASEPVKASWDGKERMVVVNHKFLLDALGACSGQTCRFMLGSDSKSKKSVVLLRDDGTVGVINQMFASFVGY